MNATKTIRFAREGSGFACQHGFPETGCYSVSLLDRTVSYRVVCTVATFAEAWEVASALPEPFSREHLMVTPQDLRAMLLMPPGDGQERS